jgi:hypothetical protein
MGLFYGDYFQKTVGSHLRMKSKPKPDGTLRVSGVRPRAPLSIKKKGRSFNPDKSGFQELPY